jgi:hypothetical protein
MALKIRTRELPTETDDCREVWDPKRELEFRENSRAMRGGPLEEY